MAPTAVADSSATETDDARHQTETAESDSDSDSDSDSKPSGIYSLINNLCTVKESFFLDFINSFCHLLPCNCFRGNFKSRNIKRSTLVF